MKRETLIEALDRYASPLVDSSAVCIVVRDGERERLISIYEACEQASDILRGEDLLVMKFKALVSSMKRHGLGGLYERFMGEKIDDALKC